MELEKTQSEDITELAKALVAAAAEVSHPKKNATNPHFKSRYADLPATIDAYRPAFLAQGLVVVQLVSGDCLLTKVVHSSGQWLQSWSTISPDKPTVQAFGSALTYMRRYTLQALTGIAADGDDDDGNAATKSPKASDTAQSGSW